MMSEKFILTVEQDECIKSMPGRGWPREEIIERHAEGKWTDKLNESLNGLSLSQLARILYEPNSYEVEKAPFEVGQWVTRNKTMETDDKGWLEGYTFQIMNIESVLNRSSPSAIEDTGRSHNLKSLRHATAKEIIFAELGREVGEFVDGDVVVFDDDSSCRIEPMYPHTLISIKGKHKKGQLKGFYPANSFIKLP